MGVEVIWREGGGVTLSKRREWNDYVSRLTPGGAASADKDSSDTATLALVDPVKDGVTSWKQQDSTQTSKSGEVYKN
jgi:hypothetical protein